MTSHDAKINLPTLRDADHYDDWKYKVVAFLVTLRLYQPIAEGRAPLQLQDIHDDAATANLQRARDALAAKQKAERAAGQQARWAAENRPTAVRATRAGGTGVPKDAMGWT